VGLCGSSKVGLSLGARGVETVEEGRPLVTDRAEFDEGLDCGREVESWASSKVSCLAVSHGTVCSFGQVVAYAFSV